jgi:hypothetical protein
MRAGRACDDVRTICAAVQQHILGYAKESQTLVKRFLGLDGYEWFVTIAGTVMIGLAVWMM